MLDGVALINVIINVSNK